MSKEQSEAYRPDILVDRKTYPSVGRPENEFEWETGLTFEERLAKFTAIEAEVGRLKSYLYDKGPLSEEIGTADDLRNALKILEQSATAHAGRITPTELQSAINEQRIGPDVVANLRQRTGDMDDRARARIDAALDRLKAEHTRDDGLSRDDDRDRER